MTGVIFAALGVAGLIGALIALIYAPEIARWWKR